jgi:aryl-alcohol dehydrogenase-like predicted oxidoreductase
VIREDVETSLSRLGVSTIDLWLFHRDDPGQPVGPLVETLNELVAAGKITAFGGSNWTHPRIAEANEYADTHGLQPMVVSSPNFSLAEQVESPWGDDCITISGPANAEAREWYRSNQMALISWSSLAGGFLSGRLTRDNVEEMKDHFPDHTMRCYGTDDNWERIARATELGRERGLTVAQVALAFVLHQPFSIFALTAARDGDELTANAAALEADLSAEEIEWLDLRSEERG